MPSYLSLLFPPPSLSPSLPLSSLPALLPSFPPTLPPPLTTSYCSVCIRSHLVATELVAFHHCGRGTGELGVWDWYIHLRHEGGGEEAYFIHLKGREGGREEKREEGGKEREGLKTRVHPT